MRLEEISGVRASVGSTSGSAVCVQVVNGVSRWLSNAHVWSTQTGRSVFIHGVDALGASRSATGRIVAAGYRSGQAIDWCVAEFPVDLPFPYEVHPLREHAAAAGWLTCGSPRAERPSVRRLGPVSSSGGVLRAIPPAIGGQSGSGSGHEKRTHGLVTWTDGSNTLMQSVAQLRQTMRPEFFEDGGVDPCGVSFDLPPGAVPICHGDPQPCEEGFHGSVEAASQVFGDDGPVVELPLWLELLLLIAPVILEWLRGRQPRAWALLLSSMSDRR
jgi:hypothetical protein